MRTLALAALLAVALAGTLQPVAAGDDALDEAAAALEAKISDLDDFKSAAEDKLKAAAAEAAAARTTAEAAAAAAELKSQAIEESKQEVAKLVVLGMEKMLAK